MQVNQVALHQADGRKWAVDGGAMPWRDPAHSEPASRDEDPHQLHIFATQYTCRERLSRRTGDRARWPKYLPSSARGPRTAHQQLWEHPKAAV